MVHELNISFNDIFSIESRVEPFELEVDNGDYSIGDWLHLRVLSNDYFIGLETVKQIDYIVKDDNSTKIRIGLRM